MILICLLLIVLLLSVSRRGGRDRANGSLTGIWRQATGEKLVGYLYFSREGAVYYMASKIPATEAMFTEKFRVAQAYTGRCFAQWEYSLRERECGGLILSVSGAGIEGTYYRVQGAEHGGCGSQREKRRRV